MAQIGKPPCDDALILRGTRHAPCAPSARRWVLAAAIVGSSMAFIDGTVVNVALPAIQRDLNATAFEAQWVVESYALVLAALLLIGGSLGDRFGRRKIFAVGVAIFAVASVACTVSADVSMLIAARALQGLGAALLVPGSLALISASFPEKERGRAIGTWSGFSGITAALGPVLGGYLVEHYSWTWAFLINVPLAVVVLAITRLRVPESRSAAATRLDPGGALLATAALSGIVYAFMEAPTQHWSAAPVRVALIVGIAATAAFVVVERRVPAPMVPMSLFRDHNFSGANLLTLLLYAALGGALFFFPLNLIQVQGYTATVAGAALLPFILIMFVLSRWAGTLVDRFGPKPPLIVGPLIAAVGFALFALPHVETEGASYWTGFFPAVITLGLGMAVTVAPLTTTVMNAVGPDLAGLASGINNAVARTAALLAIAGFASVMAWAFDASMEHGLRAARAPADVVALLETQRAQLAAAQIPPNIDPELAAALRETIKRSYVSGFRWIMLLSAALAVLSAGAAWVLIGGRLVPAPQHE
ncbi:MAG TPA: MFS transporter [Burkholderiaceae bacterium]|nr:MFS transporter [Burkholderiaceae bacterium]